jgi:hypothetical protein
LKANWLAEFSRDLIEALQPMTRTFDGLDKITDALSGTAWMVLFALLLTIPLMATHFYARAYIEPTIESSDDCKDPNARPGSRAEKSASVRAG